MGEVVANTGHRLGTHEVPKMTTETMKYHAQVVSADIQAEMLCQQEDPKDQVVARIHDEAVCEMTESPMEPAVTIKYVQARHSKWIKGRGWRKTDPCTAQSDMQALAILVADIGSAINVCLKGRENTPEFGTELADIILSALEFADRNGVNLSEWVCFDGQKGLGINVIGRKFVEGAGTRITPIESLAYVVPEITKVMWGCSKTSPWVDLKCLASVVTRTIILAERQGVDMEACLLAEMEANEGSGLMRSCAGGSNQPDTTTGPTLVEMEASESGDWRKKMGPAKLDDLSIWKIRISRLKELTRAREEADTAMATLIAGVAASESGDWRK